MLKSVCNKVSNFTCCKKDLILLITRISAGVVFAQAGLGKFMNFDRTVAFFNQIGIPFAELNVVLAAGTELIGGLFLIAGFMTRVISVPLAFVMFIALITAHKADLNGLTSLFGQPVWVYMCLFLLISAVGAGKYSLDAKYCDNEKNCCR